MPTAPLIAESELRNKGLMIRLVVNLLVEGYGKQESYLKRLLWLRSSNCLNHISEVS